MPEVLPLQNDEVYPEEELPQSSGGQSNSAAADQNQSNSGTCSVICQHFVTKERPQMLEYEY